ncbi:MAG: TRAM domain-containing protein, partial [Candidatus Gastranaerophilales bacterium]|nr:TRAM domain-containing protein [Candidatus Gastranaerophilales bacterium]
MLNKGDIIELHIDELVYGGDGIGKIEGFPIFVPDAAPGDLVKVEIISSSKSYARGSIVEIIKPSEYRIKSTCPLAKVCGGCQWQHIQYNEQLKAKKKIVQDSLKKIARLDIPVNDVISALENLEYRCKVQYPVRQTKVSRKYLVGYFKKGTHEVVNIKYCPVQPRIIDKITEFVREKMQKLQLNSYNEKTGKGLIR